MKIQNTGLDNAYAIVRGWVSEFAAAASGLISVSDETTGTSIAPVNAMTLPGQLLKDGGSGSVIVDIQAVLTDYTNNSGVDLVAGDVVVIDSSADLAITTTTTAQDTRPVGIVLGPIGAGGVGPVQTAGIIQSINVTASVTRGYYAETSTTAKQATQNATRHAGSFGVYLEAGTTPAVLLFGITDGSSSSLTVAEEDGTPSVSGVSTIKVPNDGLVNNGAGSVSIHAVLPDHGGHEVRKLHGNLGATATIDLADGNYHAGTINANCTLTFTGATTGLGDSFTFEVTGDGTHTLTFPGSVTWLTDTPGTIANAVVRLMVFETRDGGTNWYAALVGAGLSSSSFATPAIVLGTAAAAGAATTVIRSDSTIVAFDTTVPTTSAVGDAAATGSVAKAARRDHVHGRESFATPAIVLGSAAAAGAATTPIRSDSTIAAFDTTLPSGDGTAATGSLAFASRADHVHPATAAAAFTIIGQETRVSDGSTTSWTLDNDFEADSCQAFNLTSGKALTVTETLPNTVVISAAGTAGDSLSFAYAATAI